MSTRDDLLDAIRADPEADGPRLVCADWLDEHGEPERAECIRAQCRLARLDPAEAGAFLGLYRRTNELLAAHGARWAAAAGVAPAGVSWRGWDRGFPETLVFQHPRAFDAPLPPASEVEIRDPDLTAADFRRLSASPLGAIRQAALCRLGIHETTLLAFAQSDWGVSVGSIRLDGFLPLDLSQHWRSMGHQVRVTAWTLSDQWHDASWLEPLLRCGPGLRALSMRNVLISRTEELFTGPTSATLRELRSIEGHTSQEIFRAAAARCPALDRVVLDADESHYKSGMMCSYQRDLAADTDGRPSPRALAILNASDQSPLVWSLPRVEYVSGVRHLIIRPCHRRPFDVRPYRKSPRFRPDLVLDVLEPW